MFAARVRYLMTRTKNLEHMKTGFWFKLMWSIPVVHLRIATKKITYDETGNIAEIGTVFDDYTRLTSTFVDGNLVNALSRDGF